MRTALSKAVGVARAKWSRLFFGKDQPVFGCRKSSIISGKSRLPFDGSYLEITASDQDLTSDKPKLFGEVECFLGQCGSQLLTCQISLPLHRAPICCEG